MPHPSYKQHLAHRESAFAEAMGLISAPRPTWLAKHIALLSTLKADRKQLDLQTLKCDQDAIHRTKTYQAGLAKTSTLEVPHRVTGWGLMEMKSMETSYYYGRFREVVALKFRPRLLASEPELLADLNFFGEFWALDRVFTEAIHQFVGRYRGPGKLFVNPGEDTLDAAVVFIVCPSGCTNWHAVGEAVAALFGERFDSAIVKLLDRTRNVHHTARRDRSSRRSCQRNQVS
ncbi:hypothetical protein [Paraburkholderia adhaesiva]|uniref:hypothetical protein n=1 Tax=Paraburkholderia adhaesiva TaxID=2883244 RepID=UPI001F3922A2|nr:hypothetical protein [Paraburkholderia adhaesiva]